MSYAHADADIAARLHRAIETYRVPKTLTARGKKKLAPIFRDTAELTAHHNLSEKIREAVNRSRFLIVLCSPAAKISHWVNEEVRLFRKIHGDEAVLCVLATGTPETSFPPALTEGGREPLAANLSGGKDSFRLGVTQLAAAMLGVGLDALIQREEQRRRNRLWLITSSSVLFSAIMGGMAFTAVKAQNAAETSRSEAEKMVEFMLTDLRQDLAPIGKLDILNNVGSRAAEYYNAIPNANMDDDRLAREARARHLLAEVALDQGDIAKAEAEIEAAYLATQEVLRRNPKQTGPLFAHAQSAYWQGELRRRAKKYPQIIPYWQEYEALSAQLHGLNPDNVDWIKEAAFAQNNLGFALRQLKEYDKALVHYEASTELFKRALSLSPGDSLISFELANVLAGASLLASNLGQHRAAKSYRLEQIEIYEALLLDDPKNYPLLFRKAQSMRVFFENFEPDESVRAAGLNEVKSQLRLLIEHDANNILWNQEYEMIKP